MMGPLALIGAAATLFKKKAPAAPAPSLLPQRNDAELAADARDRVARRRGVGANLILGAGGAESSAGGKVALGS